MTGGGGSSSHIVGALEQVWLKCGAEEEQEGSGRSQGPEPLLGLACGFLNPQGPLTLSSSPRTGRAVGTLHNLKGTSERLSNCCRLLMELLKRAF